MRRYWGLLVFAGIFICLAGCAVGAKVETTVATTVTEIQGTTAMEPVVTSTAATTAPTTEPTTESATELVTEPTEEPTTEPVTEPATEPVTEPITQPEPAAPAEILLVNPWNYIPEGYEPDLVELPTSVAIEDMLVDRSCYDDLMQMLKDCNKECPEVCVVSAYRTWARQERNFKRKTQKYLDAGYSQEEAERLAAMVNARPGTSEHQIGLAVDIIDTRLWNLVEEQAELPAQQWLMQNSWKYGFILRYPKDKTDITGVIYEPWHYRYVGKDAAKEIFESGLTLEEYLQ